MWTVIPVTTVHTLQIYNLQWERKHKILESVRLDIVDLWVMGNYLSPITTLLRKGGIELSYAVNNEP